MDDGFVGRTPQGTPLYRAIALLTRLQLGTQLRSRPNPKFFIALFAIGSGVIALGTITVAAVITKLPLLFPPLAPSAFILFYTPMAVQASPRTVILAHIMAVISGLFALNLTSLLFSDTALVYTAAIQWPHVISLCIAIATVTTLMVLMNCTHPPAAATALIAAMGYLAEPFQALGLICAAIILVLEAIVLNRIVGGLPYPLWRHDPRVARTYRSLAGLSGYTRTAWQEMAIRMLQRR